MVFGMIWMVLFWGAVIWAIVWAATRLGEGRRDREESALDIARRRYARGEITREEFEELRKDLS
jgi:putative membrane protein